MCEGRGRVNRLRVWRPGLEASQEYKTGKFHLVCPAPSLPLPHPHLASTTARMPRQGVLTDWCVTNQRDLRFPLWLRVCCDGLDACRVSVMPCVSRRYKLQACAEP